MNKRWILTLMLFVVLTGCSNSTGPDGNNNISMNQLEGTWKASEYVYTSVNNASLSEDVLATQGMSVTITIKSNGDYTTTVTVQGQSFSSSGNMNAGNNGDITVSDANTTATLENNKLTLITKNVTWNFGNGNEAATLRSVYVRS